MTTQDEKPGQVPDSELVHGHPYVIDPDTGLRATLDGVPYAAAHADDEALIETQKRQQAEMEVPLLAGKDNPNAFVFFAVLDGTGNDRHDQDFAPTGVAQIYAELDSQIEAGYGGGHVAAAYVTGAGTRSYGGSDLGLGYSSNDRAETMYVEFCKQADAWLKANPGAEISLASMGFSRGAEEAVLLSQLVHERGIQDPAAIEYYTRADGLIDAEFIEFDKSIPPLVEPGKVPQVVIPIDPVSEGQLENRMVYGIPPSVGGVFQLTARDETRRAFIGTEHVPPGLSDGNTRFNAEVPGAHADVGDGYYANGLGVRYTNMVKNYVNNLVDYETPLLTLKPEDQHFGLGSSNVIHDSEKHPAGPLPGQIAYDVDAYRDDGVRDNVAPSKPYEPMDAALTSGLEYRTATIADAPTPESWSPVGKLYDPKEAQEQGCALTPPAIQISSPSNAPSASVYGLTSTVIDTLCETGVFPVEKTEPAPPLKTEEVLVRDFVGRPIGMLPTELVPADRAVGMLPMSASMHPAFPMYSEAWNAMADPARTNIPWGTMSENDRSRAAAAVVAAAMVGPPPLDNINTVVLNRSNDTLIAIEGNPTDPASKRVTVPLETAVKTPVEESTRKAEAASEEQSQKATMTPNHNVQPTAASTTRAQ